MIKIISTYNERNTEEVIEYLLANKIVFERINFEEFHPYSLKISNNHFNENKNTYWHRRGRINFVPQTKYPGKLKTYINSEEKILIDSYEFFNKDSNYIGSYVQEENHNKLIDLKIAITAGLKIPETLCTNNKKELNLFFEEHKNIITKTLNYPFFYSTEKYECESGLTVELDQEDIDNLSDYFIPALFQKKIDKKFEIRIFYINEQLFPMAIFSQNDQQTSIDYRNYNPERQNRNVPFKLPNETNDKIIQFIRNKKANTGSIDLIYSVNNEYIFLEDNPMGQYDWVSKFCNYYIEREIFKQLTNGKNI